jgi:tRNA (guanine26-N2/guanine27-N2)-dimethyltransferase
MALPSSSKPVPDGFTALHESTTEILIPSTSLPSNPADNPTQTKQVFLNPVQEYNRDLSIVAIRCWSELRAEEQRRKWEKGMQKGNAKAKGNKKRRIEEETAANDGDEVKSLSFCVCFLVN